MSDTLKLGYYVLLLLPGFIFVQVFEYHLVREKKPQFEKSLEIVLYSAFIWLIAYILPVWWPWSGSREHCFSSFLPMLPAGDSSTVMKWTPALLRCTSRFFLSTCLWTFVGANLWGITRKWGRADALMKWATGRDWYPSVSFKFLQSNLNKPVVVDTGEKRYLGILFGAPDTKEDPYIILTNVHLVTNGQIEPLPLVDNLLVRLDQLKEVQALSETVLQKTTEPPSKSKKKAAAVPPSPSRSKNEQETRRVAGTRNNRKGSDR